MGGDWEVNMTEWTQDARDRLLAVGFDEDERERRRELVRRLDCDSPEDHWPPRGMGGTSGYEVEHPAPERAPEQKEAGKQS